jgi:hypothetical protein
MLKRTRNTTDSRVNDFFMNKMRNINHVDKVVLQYLKEAIVTSFAQLWMEELVEMIGLHL